MAKNFDGSLSGRTTIDKTQEGKASAYLRSNKRLNRQRQKEGEKKEKGENKEKGGEENESNSRNLRQQLMNAKTRKKKKNIKKKTTGKTKEKVLPSAKMATGRALRWSWLSLISSWGLTLIYIDIHVFMHFVLSDVFCGLGEEWRIGRIGIVDKNAEGRVKIAEIIIWALINLLVLAAIALILAIIVLLVQIVAHPYDALMTGVQMIGKLIEDTVGGIIGYFVD